MDYDQYLKSEDWLRKKYLKRLKRNNCAICNSKKNLDVHHLNYKNLHNVEQSDLRVLCRRCHFLAHDLQKSGKLTFKSTNHHSRFVLLKMAVKKELKIAARNLFNSSSSSSLYRPRSPEGGSRRT